MAAAYSTYALIQFVDDGSALLCLTGFPLNWKVVEIRDLIWSGKVTCEIVWVDRVKRPCCGCCSGRMKNSSVLCL